MTSTIQSFVLDGISARPVRVEVDVHRGLPSFAIVGIPGDAVKEARLRVRAAIVNSGLEFPLTRIVVSVTPAVPPAAGALDLAIIAGILADSGQIDPEGISAAAGIAIVGEVGLDGALRPTPGAVAMAEAAGESGARCLVVPSADGAEAALVGRPRLAAIDRVVELASVALGELPPTPDPRALAGDLPRRGLDLAELRGMTELRHALEVSAAGGHHLLLTGPPGSGAALGAARLPTILPPPTDEEAFEMARIASATGRTAASGRPLRAPHHAISAAGLIGGGNPPRPGEVTLAHRGVLFLDDLQEFSRDAIEAVRAVVAAGEARSYGSGRETVLPARFLLMASALPCPCGHGADDPDCTCLGGTVARFRRRLATFAAAFDIRLDIQPPTVEEIAGPPAETSEEVRRRVVAARERAESRLGRGRTNAEMTYEEIRDIRPAPSATAYYAALQARVSMPEREGARLLSLARTLADLDGADRVDERHLEGAAALRRPPGKEA
jgi:magnesium chelatase family protein